MYPHATHALTVGFTSDRHRLVRIGRSSEVQEELVVEEVAEVLIPPVYETIEDGVEEVVPFELSDEAMQCDVGELDSVECFNNNGDICTPSTTVESTYWVCERLNPETATKTPKTEK